MTKARAYVDLPPATPRAARGGPTLRDVADVRLKTVTPIFGGSHRTREEGARVGVQAYEIDVIRAPSVRGHLRFWWRALGAAKYATPEELHKRESALFGSAATEDGGRSAVEVRVSVENRGSIDRTEISLFRKGGQPATPGAYALWPARGETNTKALPAPRRQPGTQFKLILKIAGTTEDEVEIRNALRAWILFGGYGGRTRRGLGSLTVIGERISWLPSSATREGFTQLFGSDIFETPPGAPGDVPWLGGASLHVGSVDPEAQRAWLTALDWLREFRQGTPGARNPGPRGNSQRPSISNWPEADKVRHLSTPRQGLPWAHRPRHNSTPAWPRATFGLPIIGQFQTKSRVPHPTRQKGNGKPDEQYWNELPQNHPNYGTEPEGFELRWRAPKGDPPQEYVEHDRFASPLIVKALPLADGRFAPCALWLSRGYPKDAQVGLARLARNAIDPATVAPFDRLVAPGDTPRFSALTNKSTLREAFLDWLRTEHHTDVVAP